MPEKFVQWIRNTSVAASGIVVLLTLAVSGSHLHAWQNRVDVGQRNDAPGSSGTATPSKHQATSAADLEIRRIWRVGANIRGASKPISNVLVTFPIPTDWPEQHVNLYQENIPTEARRADFRVSDGVKQMVALIPRVDSGAEVEINVLMDITVRGVSYPSRTDHLIIAKRPPRDVRLYLNPSPLIESRDRKIRKQVREIVDGIDSPWEQVRAIWSWVTTEIDVRKGQVQGAAKTVGDKSGSPEDLSNLFIALCRSHKVPARMVWADNGEYAEFYLQDDTGAGKWYPAVLEGKKEFGQMTNPRVIIQKGDNIKVPEKQQRQRLVVEFVTGSGTGPRPRVRFLRDVLPSRDAK